MVLGGADGSGADFGAVNPLSAGKTVNVEFVSANPTGPMHVGHVSRRGVRRCAGSNLLAFAGYAVTREYYINDGGGQVDVLARSAFLRYREALGETVTEIAEGLYPGDYLIPVGASGAEGDIYGDALLDKPEAGVARRRSVRSRSMAMMDMIRADLAALEHPSTRSSSPNAVAAKSDVPPATRVG